MEKYKKCRKKIMLKKMLCYVMKKIMGERWHFLHLKITAEKNLFRQQFGNNITILKQEIFFKGSEVFFPRFLKKTIFLRIF